MPKDFDDAAKEILNLSDSAIIPFLNASFQASHPPDARVIRTNNEYRVPPAEGGSGRKTIIADEVFLIDDTYRYHIEIELTRKAGMAVRMFRYDAAEALEHPTKEDGVQTINFPKSLVIYLEPPASTPDYELLRVRFPNGACYDYRVPVIKLTELSVGELAEHRLLIFAPLYILKMRRKLKLAKTPDERRRLAAELAEIRKELDNALKWEQEAGSMNEVDENKIEEMTELLHGKIYGGYTECKEETMNIPQRMRLIERHFSEMDEMKRSHEEAISRAERRSREDTARNILRLGLSVEQVTQATGLPRETVQALASQVRSE